MRKGRVVWRHAQHAGADLNNTIWCRHCSVRAHQATVILLWHLHGRCRGCMVRLLTRRSTACAPAHTQAGAAKAGRNWPLPTSNSVSLGGACTARRHGSCPRQHLGCSSMPSCRPIHPGTLNDQQIPASRGCGAQGHAPRRVRLAPDVSCCAPHTSHMWRASHHVHVHGVPTPCLLPSQGAERV